MGAQLPESKRILLADDEADVRTTLKLLLEIDHHTVVDVGDGKEALDRFDNQGVDLVITDYVMPELTGDRLAVEIKRRRPELPVIMITANADLLPAHVPGVDFILPKPFQIHALRDAIRKVTAPDGVKS